MSSISSSVYFTFYATLVSRRHQCRTTSSLGGIFGSPTQRRIVRLRVQLLRRKPHISFVALSASVLDLRAAVLNSSSTIVLVFFFWRNLARLHCCAPFRSPVSRWVDRRCQPSVDILGCFHTLLSTYFFFVGCKMAVLVFFFKTATISVKRPKLSKTFIVITIKCWGDDVRSSTVRRKWFSISLDLNVSLLASLTIPWRRLSSLFPVLGISMWTSRVTLAVITSWTKSWRPPMASCNVFGSRSLSFQSSLHFLRACFYLKTASSSREPRVSLWHEKTQVSSTPSNLSTSRLSARDIYAIYALF